MKQAAKEVCWDVRALLNRGKTMTASDLSRLDRIERILEIMVLRQDAMFQRQQLLAHQLQETRVIADSNVRAIQAWEARIEETRIEAEDECFELRVGLNELRELVAQLVQESRENIAQHISFRGEIQDLRDQINESSS